MLQDNGRAIIERSSVVVEAVNDAVEGGQHGRTGFHEEVEAGMKRAPFGAVIARPSVLIARVNRAGLVVSADTHAAVSRAHAFKDVAIELLKIGHVRQRSYFAAADAQVKDNRVGAAQIRFDHASEAVPVVAQPAHYFIAAWVGGLAADAAEKIVGEARVDARQLFEQRPRRLLADLQIGILRLNLLLVGCIDHADAQPRTDQWI